MACKDWLTNKVDRSVTGRVAQQQCVGEIQLPLSNLGISALDYKGVRGIATALGHASIPALIDPAAGSRLSVSEALTNLVWAPIADNLKGVSLSANWMWPAKQEGETARLYQAVKALSDYCVALGINGFLGGILAHDGFFVADGDKLSVFHGKGLGFGEVVVNGIDDGVVDDKVHGCFVVAGGHKGQD